MTSVCVLRYFYILALVDSDTLSYFTSLLVFPGKADGNADIMSQNLILLYFLSISHIERCLE